MTFRATRHQVDDIEAMQQLCREQGWGDGLPVLPPTPERVAEFLDAAGLAPETVVATAPERNVKFVAESVAVNAVMAGGRPEQMPVLVAAIEAVCDPHFKFNHLASLGSPWPLFIVSGPIVEDLGLHADIYPFGPESSACAQLSRAFSFSLRNIAYARTGGIQRGQWGNPVRWQAFIGDDPGSAWGPMHTERKFAEDASVLTAASIEPGAPYQIKTTDPEPERMLDALCDATAGWGAALWCRGTYVVLVGPHHAAWLSENGWSRADVRRYVLDHTKATVADLKKREAWGHVEDIPPELREPRPGDEKTDVYLFKDNPGLDQYVWARSAREDRECDVLIAVAGGDAGRRFSIGIPYEFSTNPVSRVIDTSKISARTGHQAPLN